MTKHTKLIIAKVCVEVAMGLCLLLILLIALGVLR